MLHGSGCVPSAVWDFSSGTHGSFIFLPRNQFLGEVLSSEIEESQKQKKMVHPYRCTRFLKKDRRQVYFVTQSFAVFIVTAPTTLLEGLVCEHPFSRMNASGCLNPELGQLGDDGDTYRRWQRRMQSYRRRNHAGGESTRSSSSSQRASSG